MSRPSITTEDPQGRADIFLLRAAEFGARRLNAGQVWDRGLGQIVEEIIVRTVPSEPIDPIAVLDRLGLLPADRRRHQKKVRAGAARSVR